VQVLLVLAVVATLAAAEMAAEPAGSAGLRLIATLAASAAAPLWAVVISQMTSRALRQGTTSRGALLRRFARLRAVHSWIWLAAVTVVVLGLRWTQVVRCDWDLASWPLVDDLAVLAPVLLPLVLSWAAFYDVDRAVRETAAAGASTRGTWSRVAYLAFQFRTHAGLVLAPLALLLVAQDLVRFAAPQFAAGPYGWIALVPPLGVMIVGFPVLVRWVWPAAPLPDGPLRQRLQATARRWGLRIGGIYVWQTRGMVLNAAVAGFLPRLRYVFLSDALLERLSEAEIEAVFGHEIGHIRHHHVFLRAMVLVVPFGLYAAARHLLGEAWVPDWDAASGSAWVLAAGLAAAVAAAGLYIAVVFGFVSRRLERQADLFGCRVAAESADDSAPAIAAALAEGVNVFVAALEKLSALSGQGRNSPSWQHGSIARRVEFLHRVAADPAAAARCHLGVRLLGCAIVGLALIGLALPLLG
jgi:STE24 endopeptidase